MAESLLLKLQEKPLPKEYKPQFVELKEKHIPEEKPDIILNVPILDKRSTIVIDRTDILKKIKPNINIETTISEKLEKLEKPEKLEKSEKPKKSEKPEKLEKSEKPKKSEKPEKVENPEKPEKLEKSEKPALEKSEKPEKLALELDESELKQKPQKNIKKITVIESTKPDVELPSRVTKKPEPVFIANKLSLLNAKELIPRLPKPEPPILIRSSYYLNNRKMFISTINSLFNKYKKEMSEAGENYTCNKTGSNEFSRLPHQNIVRDYINLITPYRGLLLYHGLGSGKTCSSIGIAESLKSDKQIVIMTPASLRVNYIEELKKCGDKLYKKHQYWEFINILENPELLEPLSYVLHLSIQFIEKNGGVWFVNVKKDSNYNELTSGQQTSLDKQLNEMIKYKYKFINYNGIRLTQFNKLREIEENPFSNKVVIIDEAHNFVSRIVNKLKHKSSLSLVFYDLLMRAENAKIILLTGTPIINYPNEIAIAMNIIRGYIVTLIFNLDVTNKIDAAGNSKVTENYLIQLFKAKLNSNNVFDYLQYKVKDSILTLTRNPYGFISYSKPGEMYAGVTHNESGNIDNDTFINIIVDVLNTDKITVINKDNIQKDSIKYTCLPDSLDEFSAYFIKSESEKNKDEKKKIYSNVKNMNQFKRRILGLISYFPDIDALLPKYEKEQDFHIIYIEMSDFQFASYEEARVQERKVESSNAKRRKKAGNVYEESTSTYRIFSRAFCNFVFPRPIIIRPLPNDNKEMALLMENNEDEDVLDAISLEEKIKDGEGKYDVEDIDEIAKIKEIKKIKEIEELEGTEIKKSYEQRISSAIRQLEENSAEFLTNNPLGLPRLSPKFLHLLDNIIDADHIGLHLIYSQFRTLEGIGILSLILKANGFAQFKIKKDAEWVLDIPLEDRGVGKPLFVLYTGTETSEEKELIRNIFNSNWDTIPSTLKNQLEAIYPNNFLGEIIKVMMRTASGAEGISLSNVRYVHITEPYWHPVRIEQVIGRARRICSHDRLPKALQTVTVFLYLMIFSEAQKTDERSIELRLKDFSKLDKTNPLTSDEALYEISRIKENINKEIIHNIKEAAIDCNVHSKLDGKEKLQCFTFGSSNPTQFSYLPSLASDDSDKMTDINKFEEKIEAYSIVIPNIGKCAVNSKTKEVYDLDSYMKKNPIIIGHLKIDSNGDKIFIKA